MTAYQVVFPPDVEEILTRLHGLELDPAGSPYDVVVAADGVIPDVDELAEHLRGLLERVDAVATLMAYTAISRGEPRLTLMLDVFQGTAGVAAAALLGFLDQRLDKGLAA